MSRTLHAFDYLDAEDLSPAVCAVFGDEPFLKRLVIQHLSRLLCGEEQALWQRFEGPEVEWRDISDELATRSLFGDERRLVLVDNADKFVSANRGQLEDYVARPHSNSVLLLEVGTWASNTKLYKALNKTGLQIDCRPPEKAVGRRKVPDTRRLRQWLIAWTSKQHRVQLGEQASELLLDLIGPELGLLDQALAKLSLFIEVGGEITTQLVTDVVGGWRTKTIWELIDAAADGNAAEALKQLDQLLLSGEAPIALFGQIAWSLRRFAAATRIYEQSEHGRRRIGLGDALVQAGVAHWNRAALERAESQLKQLGRHRAGQLYGWLLELDLALKGTHSTPDRARLALEQLLARMAREPTKRLAR